MHYSTISSLNPDGQFRQERYHFVKHEDGTRAYQRGRSVADYFRLYITIHTSYMLNYGLYCITLCILNNVTSFSLSIGRRRPVGRFPSYFPLTCEVQGATAQGKGTQFIRHPSSSQIRIN